MSRRPTARATISAVVGLVLVLGGITAQAGWLFVLAAGCLGTVGASALTRHGLRRLEVTRHAPARACVGEAVTVTVEIRNRSRRPLPPLRLEDRSPALETAALACDRLGPDERARADLDFVARRRGTFAGGEVIASCGWPFGLVRSTRALPAPAEMTVVPRWVELRSFPLLEPASYPSEVLHERARVGAGADYLGVREYRAGDSLRSVHWRSTARRGHLVVREYEEEGENRVAVVLAGAGDGDSPDSLFEMLVSAAASIGSYALVTGHPVALVASGRLGLERISGGHDSLLEWLAGIQGVDAPLGPSVASALQWIGRRGTVVLLAPDEGRAGADLGAAVRRVQSARARAVVVAALTRTWSVSGGPGSALEELGARAPLRTLSAGRDLRSCLEAS